MKLTSNSVHKGHLNQLKLRILQVRLDVGRHVGAITENKFRISIYENNNIPLVVLEVIRIQFNVIRPEIKCINKSQKFK